MSVVLFSTVTSSCKLFGGENQSCAPLKLSHGASNTSTLREAGRNAMNGSGIVAGQSPDCLRW